jgi:cytochrome c-type biogenesis protein CcsB
MQLTVVLLLMFAISAGVATFIENDFGTTAAKIAVYNATWFEILLLLLAVNLMGSLIENKMWRKKKYTLFLFHVSFIVILVGAGITRYYGYEGMMHIREGSSSDQLISNETYISALFNKEGQSFVKRKQVLLAGNDRKKPGFSLETDASAIDIKMLDFVPNAAVVLTKVPNGEPIISMMVVSEMGNESVVLRQNESMVRGNSSISFDDETAENAIQINLENGKLFITAPTNLVLMNMAAQTSDTIAAGQKVEFAPMQLYAVGGNRIVLRQFEESASLRPVPSNQQNQGNGMDAMLLEVSTDDDTREIVVWGKKGIIGDFKPVKIKGETIRLSYGSIPIQLPFAIQLNKFILDRYPGSNSPSSYASEVTLLDEANDYELDFRIYMNHILNYKGYRFYQSSYDTDELGTVLSVNHDGLGTIISYIGYALMALGMVLSLVSRKTRFRKVLRMISETREKRTSLLSSILFIGLIVPSIAFSQAEFRQVNGVEVNVVNKDHADEFGHLIVLSTNGRLEPMNTLSSKILRKFSGKSTFEGLNSDQVFIGIFSDPATWQTVPLIKVKDAELRKLLNINGKYASFSDFFNFDQRNSYKLGAYVDEAHQKKTMDQTKFDKEVISADEKVNIFYMVYSGNFLRLFPRTYDPKAQWYNPNDKVEGSSREDSLFVTNVISMYVESLNAASQDGSFATADDMVNAINMYQKKYAAEVLPTEKKTNIEILSNKADVFERLFKFYGLFGLVFLLVLFLNLVFTKFKTGILRKSIVGILLIAFIFQTLGLAARWYIAGHAPLSNGYESMIFLSWATMLAGFLLVRRSNIALAATTVLASLILFVAHLNWMNPEVTNLVPVLKSVWLTIHVAIIVSSYGFLGLGMILGLFNLLLMIFQNKKNLESFNLTIKEISLTSEATMTIGLYMISIGTFLGGVWANESWGRYWGWDPKETWALVSILVYAFIIHLNFIPGVVGRYLFNALSVLGFSSILMTYFGVNYYLSGLHSYAAGDPVPIPTFVYYTIAALAVILVLAYINNFKMGQLMKQEKRV